MAKTVALIPARAGSKGVANKNIRLLGGRPLIAWSIAACLKTSSIDRVIVTTDSEDYAALCRELGADVPFLRPAAISGDHSTDFEFVTHALDWLAANGEDPETVVHIRPTTPLRDPVLVEQAIQQFRAPHKSTALRSVHEMSESAYKTFEIDGQGRLKRLGSKDTFLDSANNARQQFPPTFNANGYVDVLSTAYIRNHNLLHGDAVMPFITPRVTEVDNEADLAFLEYQLQKDAKLASRLFG
jgi:CMP-N,N'-diacetyllegionaminic acid synthase